MPEIIFPIKGIHKGFGTEVQPQFTTRRMNNFRPYNTQENILVGGQRPALDKWGNGDQVGAAEQPVVAMVTVSTIV